MNSEYELMPLGDLAKLRSGYSFKGSDWREDGTPVIKIANVKAGRIVPDGCGYVDLLTAKAAASWMTEPDDVLVAMTGYVGEVARIRQGERYLINQRVGRFDAINSEKIIKPYLFYVLQHPEIRSAIEQIARGSAQPNLSANDAHRIEVPVAPLAIQTEIANILGALDDRITLLRETNATLEAIAQAMFKSWFVDFDPVRAKQEGRAPEGIDEATAALFPDSFEESELGLVPMGWRVESLDGIADFLNGLALQKFPPENDSEWLPVIKIAQLRKGDVSGADRASKNIKPEYIVQNSDVLFSWSGSLEVEIWCGGAGALNQHLFKVTSAKFPKWFYYRWTRNHLSSFQQVAASKATTMGHIQRKHLTEAKVMVPPTALLDAANEIFAPLLDDLINNALQAQTLATLRDTLLPRLISGQLRLPEAEAMLDNSAV